MAIHRELYFRHRLPVRIMHWINVIALVVLLMSGLMIFNAHPTLYWGEQSYGGAPEVLRIDAVNTPDGVRGATTLFGHSFDTTGVFGLARNAQGIASRQAFPHWLTIPSSYSLALARRWHFFFMWVFLVNGLTYVLWSIVSRHLARDLAPTRADLGSIWQSIKDHVRFKHHTGEAAKRYNVLQKLTYLLVIFVLLPLVILMGFANVAGARCAVARMGGSVRRAPIGAHAAFRRGVRARRVHRAARVPRDHDGTVEQPALDDHGAFSRRYGGRR